MHVPPLSERRDDIPLLANYFMDQVCSESGMQPRTISKEAMDELVKLPWTGNIRELRNVIERLIILCGDIITKEDVTAYASAR